MKAEVKKAWVERLRSEEVEQASGHLGYGDGSRCCLGVLCDLAVEAEVITRPKVHGLSQVMDYGDDKDWSDINLPSAVMAWAGLDSESPCVEYKGVWTALTDLNDGAGETPSQPFPVIAGLIETSL